MNKRMPDDVYATLSAVVEKYPHTGTDDERREAMKKVVATIRARHGLAWTWKTEHQSLIAPSKDGLGYVADGSPAVHGQFTQMFIFDTINGGTRRPNAPPMMSEEPRPAHVVLVTPQDWLADAQPTPPPEPRTPWTWSTPAVRSRIDSVRTRPSRVWTAPASDTISMFWIAAATACGRRPSDWMRASSSSISRMRARPPSVWR